MPGFTGRTPALIVSLLSLCALSLLAFTSYQSDTGSLTQLLGKPFAWSPSAELAYDGEYPAFTPYASFEHGDPDCHAALGARREAYKARWGGELLRASVAHFGTGARVRRAMAGLEKKKSFVRPYKGPG